MTIINIDGYQRDMSITPELFTYALEVITYDIPENNSYPVEVRDLPLGTYSSLERAESEMRNTSDTDNPSNKNVIHTFIIEVNALDVDACDSFWEGRRYTDLGVFLGADDIHGSFNGVLEQDCRFKMGDIVEFVLWDKLRVGIITGLPLTPERVQEINADRAKQYAEGTGLGDLTGNQMFCPCDYSEGWYSVIFPYEGGGWEVDQRSEYSLSAPKLHINKRTKNRLKKNFNYTIGTFKEYRLDESVSYWEEPLHVTLNVFMMHKFQEPHVVISYEYSYLLLSLKTFDFLMGTERVFKKEQRQALDNVIQFVKQNKDQKIDDFNEMLAKFLKHNQKKGKNEQ